MGGMKKITPVPKSLCTKAIPKMTGEMRMLFNIRYCGKDVALWLFIRHFRVVPDVPSTCSDGALRMFR